VVNCAQGGNSSENTGVVLARIGLLQGTHKGNEMKNSIGYPLLILVVLLAACSPVSPQSAATAPAPAVTTAPTIEKPTAQPATPAPITPAAESGPIVIVGEANSANFFYQPETYPEPIVALLDASKLIKKEPAFVSDQGQILGTFDTGMFPLPAKFSINLPIQPTAISIDLDNNGKADAGVQIFSLAIGSNLTGDSYLQQLEQVDVMSSLIADVATGDITEGALLRLTQRAVLAADRHGADRAICHSRRPAADGAA
jgi:hypothetical protein